jgi:aryl-alcohol dehydrogenase-like predicted oxidoreductase
MKNQDIPYRALGRNGVEVSVSGLGGYHPGEPGEATAIIRRSWYTLGLNLRTRPAGAIVVW